MRRQNNLIAVGLIILFVVLGLFLVVRRFQQRQQETQQNFISPHPQESELNFLPPDQLLKLQNEADEKFKKLEDERYSQYPWYDSLPLQTDKYFVYFDLEQKKFIGKIYSPSEEANIKSDVIKILREQLQVPVEKYQFEWTIQR